MIHVTGLTRTFRSRGALRKGGGCGDVVALDGIDLDVGTGQVFGLVGVNGAGKTTLVKILSTLLLPTSGTATIKGYDVVKQDRQVRALIGLSAENERAFYWRLSGRQNLEFFGALQGLGRTENRMRVQELLQCVGLENEADRRFMEYSTGMKRKLNFARALLLDPPILILDEPTSNVDPISAEQIRDMIRMLRDGGKTILLTSHNMFEIERLATAVGMIHRGKIVAAGDIGMLRDALGRSVVVVGFARNGAVTRDALRRLPGVTRMQVSGEAVRLTTSSRCETLNAVAALSVHQGLLLAELALEQPTLEDVFFELAGATGARAGGPRV